METKQRKPLTHEDTISASETEAFIAENMTDEIARQMGYTNAQMYFMDQELAYLAGKWRETKNDEILKDYHLLYYKMIAFGFSPDGFSADTEIDPQFMPERPPQFRAEKKAKEQA